MKAEDAIESDWYGTFLECRERLYQEQMVPLNTRLFILGCVDI